MGVTEILLGFIVVLEGKTCTEMPESLRLEFSEKFSANNASVLLNRGGIADVCLLRALLAIGQQSWELSFWEMMDSFVLLAYASLAASRTLLQRLLACLNFTLESEDFSLWYKQKSDFYELWQQHKQLKTAAMSEGWPDSFDEGYIHHFQAEPTYKIDQQQKHWV